MSDATRRGDDSPAHDSGPGRRDDHEAGRESGREGFEHVTAGDVAQWTGLLPAVMPLVFVMRREARSRVEGAGAVQGAAGMDELASEIASEVGQADVAQGGSFSIELPRLGRIDGHVQVDGTRALVALRPQRTSTRELLAANRRLLERRASAAAGTEVLVQLEGERDE